MIKRIAFTASLLTALAAAAQAQVPFLSFADNGTAAITRSASSANGNGGFDSFVSGGGSGYTSLTTAAGLTSVSYTIDSPVTATATTPGLQDDATLGAGSITVVDSVLGTLFTVSFDNGELTSGQFGATDFLADNVVYSNVNSVFANAISNNGGNAFNLSFANATLANGGVTYSTSGSFASQPVPEPASMAALGLGAAAMLRRRRKA